MLQDILLANFRYASSRWTQMAIQICVMTALREVPTKLLMRRFYLIHLKKSSICQRAL